MIIKKFIFILKDSIKTEPFFIIIKRLRCIYNTADIFGRSSGKNKPEEKDNPYIRVNVVCPGFVRSNFLPEEVWDSFETEEVLSSIPNHRIGEDWKIRKRYAFLVSPKATFITGATIVIDGGLHHSPESIN